ncbi:MAG: Lrp/AsnC family transcriptional regulator [Thermoplasmatales archaeon]|nr:Lrp/AsnC family transcriptional regulator [Candidatus Thermoplasmatota archaeon]MCG2826063.1 Lrp/AsnC family transcriptional regulator [Thermoplasmatales archaeon]
MVDDRDLEILKILQENCRKSMKEIALALGCPTSTVHSRIKKMRESGVIKGYKAILDGKYLGKGTTAFILASFSSREDVSQRDVAKKLSSFQDVQEVHIITGEWDIIIKIMAKDVESVGRFVVGKMRRLKGIEKTLTCMVFESVKEGLEIGI